MCCPRVALLAYLPLFVLAGCGASGDAKDLEAMPAATAVNGPVEPATFTLLADHADLRKVVIPDDAKFQSREMGALYMVLQRDTQASVDFVREQMSKLGCKEVKSENPSTPPYVSLSFNGGGCLITAFISPESTQEKATNVVMNGVGNIDARSLPAPKGTTPATAFWTSQSMTIDGDLDQGIRAARETLAAAGWIEAIRVGGEDQATKGEQRFLTFFKNSVIVGAYVSKATAPAGKTSIQYNCTLLGGELPVPSDASDVRFWQEPNKLSCLSKAPIADVGKFYEARFKELGWKKWKDLGVVRERVGKLFYVRGNDVTMIDLAVDDKGTHIIVHGMPEHIQDDEKRAIARDKQAQIDKDSNLIDLPLPPGAHDIEYDEESRKVTFKTAKSIAEVMEFYQGAFADAGWKEHEQNRSVKEQTGNFNTVKGDNDTVFVNMFRLNAKTETEVTALAYSCRWNKQPGPAEEEPAKAKEEKAPAAEAEDPTAEAPDGASAEAKERD